MTEAEAAVVARERAYDEAWSSGDVERMLEGFTDQAVAVNPGGVVARGKDEIRAMLSEFLSGPGRGSTHATTVSTVDFVTPDVAVVDGEALIESDSIALRHRFTDVLVRRGEDWAFAHLRAYLPDPELAKSHHEVTEPLEDPETDAFTRALADEEGRRRG